MYHLRVVSVHDIHGLDEEMGEDVGSGTGCTGSAVDLKVQVKDVGPPAQAPGLDARYDPNNPGRVLVSWDPAGGIILPTHYAVSYRHASGESWQDAPNVSGTQTTINVHPAERRTHVSVAAVNSEGRGAWANDTATAPKPEISISANSASVNEGQNAVFTLRASKSAIASVTVRITWEGNHGQNGDRTVDFQRSG